MKAIITVGLPGCGKSTWAARRLAGAVRIERDLIRHEIAQERGTPFSWASWDVSLESEVTRRWEAAVDAALAARVQQVVFSDTNLHPGYRRALIKRLRDAGYEVELVLFDVPAEECCRRNAERGPLAVADDAYAKLTPSFEAARTGLSSEADELGARLVVVTNDCIQCKEELHA